MGWLSILGESGYTTIGRVGQGGVTDGALVVHGDADRVILCDEKGTIVDGDQNYTNFRKKGLRFQLL